MVRKTSDPEKTVGDKRGKKQRKSVMTFNKHRQQDEKQAFATE